MNNVLRKADTKGFIKHLYPHEGYVIDWTIKDDGTMTAEAQIKDISIINKDIIQDIIMQVADIEANNVEYNSLHEGYAIMKEEFDELWDEVKKHSHDHKKAFNEAKQVACTAIRFMKLCQRKDSEL